MLHTAVLDGERESAQAFLIWWTITEHQTGLEKLLRSKATLVNTTALWMLSHYPSRALYEHQQLLGAMQAAANSRG